MQRPKPADGPQICQRIEFEYTRHGTLSLIGNMEVTTGELISPSIGPTRTEPDFASHIERTVDTDPKASWVFVVDNLNIHCSETLVNWVAKVCGIEEKLGKKGVLGILKSVASRQAFLSDRSHRIRFVYTPKHSSWLNQSEPIWVQPVWLQLSRDRKSLKWCENVQVRGIETGPVAPRGGIIRRRGLKGDAQGTYPDR